MKSPVPKQLKMYRAAISLVSVFVFGLPAMVSAAEDIIIYDEARAGGWQNYSYGTTVNFVNTSPVHSGAHSISAAMNGWAGFYLHHDSVIDLTDYQQLSFWIRGSSNCRIRLFLNYDSNFSKYFSVTANTWTKIDVPLSELGNPPFLTDIQMQNAGSDSSVIYVDETTLVASTSPFQVGPTLSIDLKADRHAINEDIYGMNFASRELAEAVRLPVKRWGGNATSRYNWQNDTSNKGSDWYYENVSSANSNPGSLPDGSAADRFVEENRRTGTKTLLTAPLLGWVAKRRVEGHPYDCGFSVAKYGKQAPYGNMAATDPYDPDCGTGIISYEMASDGKTKIPIYVTGNNPTDTSVAIEPSFIEEWLQHLVGKYGTAENGGVAYYNLDNEPMLWNGTQRDVHPQPASYDEMRDRTYQYAAAIKNIDPSAKTLGPVVWGWPAYFYSALDAAESNNFKDESKLIDFKQHGNVHFAPWYLQEMQRYEQEHGVRILDYLDLHIYPQVKGVYTDGVGTTTAQNARLRSIRQLWDESYTHEDWIGQPVYLIPRMKQWIQDNYPGTKTAITEYDWGGLNSLSGALAQADILGVFGREGLDLATLWTQISPTSPAAYAFRMYRNYDGSGSGFGETSVQAQSTDQETLAIYAAERNEDNSVTAMVINKEPKSVESTLNLAGFMSGSTVEVFRYSSDNLKTIEQLADEVVTDNRMTTVFPGNSITLLVLSNQGEDPGHKEQPNTVLIDFGSSSILSKGNGWNNVTESFGGIVGSRLNNLVNAENEQTSLGFEILSRFAGANTNGTNNSEYFTINATMDSLYGNKENWGGLTNVNPSFKLTGLDPARAYRLTFYASRVGVSDIRETSYTVVGRDTSVVTLDPANNIDNFVETSAEGIVPDAMNEITISLAPTANNNNAYHFTYLGAMKIEENGGAPPPDPDMQTLLIDFGSINFFTDADGWNNVCEDVGSVVGGQLNDLVNTENEMTSIGLEILSQFNGANTNGTRSSEYYTSSATMDSLYGNIENWDGLSDVLPSFKLTGLNPDRIYRLTFYASRLGVSDIRETSYTVVGQETTIVKLDPANNIDNSAATSAEGIVPDQMDEITVSLAPTVRNDNGYHFIYLGAMKIEEMNP